MNVHLHRKHGECVPIKKRRKKNRFGKHTTFFMTSVKTHIKDDDKKNRYNSENPRPTEEEIDEIVKELIEKRPGDRYHKSNQNKPCYDDYGGY